MNGRFRDKVVVVTGGAHGIGRAAVDRFAAEGACVALLDIDDERASAVAAETAEAHGGPVEAIHCDVASSADWRQAVDHVVSTHGGIDVLHNNAFLVIVKPTEELTDEDWHRQLDVCLSSVFFGARACIASLRERGGCIVNTASVHATIGFRGHAGYDASKGGIVALTRQLAVEHGPAVRVNAVLPGAIATRAWDGVSAEEIETFAQQAPAKRLGAAEEVAAAVAFLASADASYITGASLDVDGGWTIAKE